MSISASSAALLNAATVTTPVAVSDSAANVALYLGPLATLAAAGKLASIGLTGTPSMTLSGTQLVNDAAALLLVSNATWTITLSGTVTAAQAVAVKNGLITKLTAKMAVSDTAADVVSSLTGLQAHAGFIASIVLTGGSTVLPLTAAQIVADASALLKISGTFSIALTGTATAAQVLGTNSVLAAKVTSGFAVSDSALNVGGNLDALEADVAKIASVALTGVTPVLSISATQLIADSAVLLKITGNYIIALTGAATAAQAVAVKNPLIVKLTVGLTVSDTAADVVSNLAGLQAHSGYIASIALTDASPVLSLTAAQILADVGALGKITGSFAIAASGTATVAQVAAVKSTLLPKITGLEILDSVLDVTGKLTTLMIRPAAIASIALTDASPALSLTAAQLVADAPVLLKITGTYGITLSGTATVAQVIAATGPLTANLTAGFAVSDTSANVVTNLAALEADAGSIASIALTDSSPVLSLTATQLMADGTVLLKISSSYTISVSGTATAAKALGVSSDLIPHLTAGFAISDSAANVALHLDALQTDISRIASIALTDVAPVLSITGTQLIADAAVLLLVGGSYGLALPGTVDIAQAVNANGTLLSHLSGTLQIADSAANVTTSLGALQTLATANLLGSITLTDGGTPSLSITAATLITDNTALSKLLGNYAVVVTGSVTAVQAVGLNAGVQAHVAGGISIADSAANISSNLDSLQAQYTTIGGITLTDGGTPTISITAAMLVADEAALALIGGSYTLAVSGSVTVAQALALGPTVTAHITAGLAISDTASDVTAHLNALQALGSVVGSIALTDMGTPTVSLTAATLVADAGVLAKITSSYTLSVSSGTVTAAQALALSGGVTTHLAGGLSVADSAANLISNLDALQALGATVGSVALTNAGAAITLSAAQIIADASLLLKINNTFGLTVTGTATTAQAADASPTLDGHLTAAFAVSDTAANVTTNLDQLQAAATASALASITLTDIGTPVLAISAATLVADAGALALIGGSFTFSVTGSVSVAEMLALNPSLAAKVTGGLTVADSTATVSDNLGALQALGATVASVVLSGAPSTFPVTATQLAGDDAILAKIVSGSGVTLTANQVTTSPASAAAGLSGAPAYTGTLLFADLGANVLTYLGALQALATSGHLGAILLSDSTAPTLAITTTQLLNDGSALAEIGSAYSLTIASGTLTVAQALGIGAPVLAHLTAALPVHDTSTNVVGNLDALQAIAGSLASVTFSNGTPTLSLTAAKAIGDIGVLAVANGYNLAISGTFTAAQAATLSTSPVAARLSTGAVVSDTSAHVSAALAGLQTLAGAGKLGPITLSDTSVLSVTPAQLGADLSVFRKITNAYTFSLTDPLTAAQAAGVSSLLVPHLPTSLAVSDSSANVVSNLDALDALALGSHLGSVGLTDGGTPVLDVSSDQLTSDATVLALITGSFRLQISGGITAAQAVTFASNLSELGGSVTVVDSAAAVGGALSALAALANASLLSAITFTDAGTPNLALSTTAFVQDEAALDAILGFYTVTLTGTLSLAQVASAATQGLLAFVTGGFVLEDSSSHIAADLALGAGGSTVLANISQITGITVDGGPLVLTVAEAETAGVSGVIGDIGGNTYDVAGAAVPDIATLDGLAYAPTSIALADTASHIATDLGRGGGSSEILGNLAQIGLITVNAGPLVLSVAEAETAGLVGKIAGHVYDVSGAAVSDLSTLEALPYTPTGITLSDSAGNIATDLALGGSSAILAALTQITAITVTGGPLTLTVAEAETAGVADGPSSVASDIAGHVYHVAGAAVSDLGTLQALADAPTGITLEDSAGNIATDLALGTGGSAMLAALSQITGITVDSGPLVLTVAEAETSGVAGAGGVIGDIAGHDYDVTGAAVSDLGPLAALTHAPVGITVQDAATHIAADLSLGSAQSKVLAALPQLTSVTVTGGPLTLTVAEAETVGVAGANGVISDISGHSYDVSGALVSDLSTLEGLAYAPAGITLADSANHIAADLALGSASSEILTSFGQITGITVQSGPLVLTVAEAKTTGVASASGVISEIAGNTYDVTGALVSDLGTLQGLTYAPAAIAVGDSASNIEADLSLGTAGSAILAALAQITGITVGSGPLVLTVAEAETTGVAGTSGVIGDITGHVYDVAGALVSDLSTLEAASYTPAAITLEDTAAHIAADLALGVDGSRILAALPQITAITVDSGPLSLTVAEAETAGVAGVIGDISGHAYNVTNAAVADLSTLVGLGYAPGAITISDSAAHIEADLALGSAGSAVLAALGQITGITVSGGPLVLTVAEAETTGVAGALGVIGDISGNTYDVADAAVSDLSTLEALSFKAAGITLNDSAAHIAADLGAGTSEILTNLAQITAITVTGGPLTLTVAEAETTGVAGVGGVISEIAGHGYNVTGALVSDLAALDGLTYMPAGIAISDSAGAIAADLGGGSSELLTNLAAITGITVSSGPLVLTVAEAETTGVAGASGVINDIAGHSYTVSGALVSDLATLQALTNAPASIAVEDNATNIAADLGLGAGSAILAAPSQISHITVDSGPLVLTAAEVTTIVNDGLSAKISGTINVDATASSMMANVDALQTLQTAGSLGTLTLTTSSPAFGVTALQANNDTTAINDVMGALGSNPSAVLYIQGTNSGDTLDISSLAYPTEVSLGSNSATMAFMGSAVSVSGTPDSLTLGSAASTVNYTVGSGTEVITGFQFGVDVLNLAFNTLNPADLSVRSVTVGGNVAIALTVSDDPSQGVILMNPGLSASVIANNDLFGAGSHVLVS